MGVDDSNTSVLYSERRQDGDMQMCENLSTRLRLLLSVFARKHGNLQLESRCVGVEEQIYEHSAVRPVLKGIIKTHF